MYTNERVLLKNIYKNIYLNNYNISKENSRKHLDFFSLLKY